MAEIKDPRGKLLLGEAVRLLVQSGAAGEAITDFINAYSEVLKDNLETLPVAAAADIKSQMKEAVKEVLHELAPPSRRTPAGLRKQVAVYVAGAKTSLYLRKDLIAKVEETFGGAKQARQLINEFANSKPSSRSNRTAWVEEQLQARLMLARAEATVLTAH